MTRLAMEQHWRAFGIAFLDFGHLPFAISTATPNRHILRDGVFLPAHAEHTCHSTSEVKRLTIFRFSPTFVGCPKHFRFVPNIFRLSPTLKSAPM